MADENVQALRDLVKAQDKADESQYPEFLANAIPVPYELQSYVAQYKRDINHELSTENLLWAIGDEVATYEVRKGVYEQVLKMHLESNNAPVYVFASEGGANYRRLSKFIDVRKKIGILTMLETDNFDEDGNREFIALGSIKQAEFVTGGLLFSEFEKDPDAVKEETRQGTVTEVVSTPTFSFISFDYEGIELGMLAREFYYQTWTRPLTKAAYIGMPIKFKITDIEKTTYDSQKGIQAASERGQVVPKGIMYQIKTTRMPFLEKPDDDVISKFKRKAEFKAYIVRYHPVNGMIVELAPGWWIKGVLPSNSQYKPSIRDEEQHTPVIVKILNLDTKLRQGRAEILRFPHGVARTLDPHQQ